MPRHDYQFVNHAWAMNRGEESLKRELIARRALLG